jgi:hypothetical protein
MREWSSAAAAAAAAEAAAAAAAAAAAFRELQVCFSWLQEVIDSHASAWNCSKGSAFL